MAGSIRCPSCGGLNPAEAEWCGQCLQRFAARTPPPPPPPPPGAETQGAEEPGAEVSGAEVPGTRTSPAPAATATLPVGRTSGAFTVTEAGIVWTCSRCEAVNALDASVCEVCGARFADVIRPPEEGPGRDPNTVALYSLFFPGAGHWYIGQKGQAVARGVLSVWVVLVALLAAIGGSTLIAVVFGIVATALWVAAAHDAYREARKESALVLLKGRAFLYLVLGLLLLMVILLVTAGVQAGRA